MKTLAELIANHPVPGAKQALQRGLIADTVSTVIGISIKPKQVKLENGTLNLAVPPIVKTTMKLRQSEITAALVVHGITVTTVR